MHLSPDDEQHLSRAAEGLRQVAAPSPDFGGVAAKMRGAAVRPAVPAVRYATVGAVVTVLGLAAFMVPRASNAATLKDVLAAVKANLQRQETCYRVAPDGKPSLSYRAWSKPGKSAMLFADGSDIRDNGTVSYIYYPTSLVREQSVRPSSGDGLDPVGIDEYIASPYGKLSRVEAEGDGQRYVFQMGETRQDLVVDKSTKLPRRRDVYDTRGRLTEYHEYQFVTELDDRLFDPDIKPGIPVRRSDKRSESGTAVSKGQ